MTIIRSASNSVLKRVRAVLAGVDRRHMVLEGERLVEDALGAGVEIAVLLVAADRPADAARWRARGQRPQVVEAELLGRVSALRTSPGLLALAAVPPRRGFEVLGGGERGLVAVAAGVADPGNLGALARVAEAAGAEALVTVAGGARPWSEKALRGSMGSLLRLPVVEAESAQRAADELTARGYSLFRAATRNGEDYADTDWSGPVALWVSGETGTGPAAEGPFRAVTIPMAGAAESLNVTAAAAVLLFAAGRSRRGVAARDDGPAREGGP